MVAARGIVGDMGIAQRLGDLFKLRPLLWVMTIGDQVAALQDELGVQADDLLDDPLVGDWVGARIAVSDEGELLGGQGGPGRDTLGGGLGDGGTEEQCQNIEGG